MALHRLKFDTTDAASIAASPSIGAYLRASDGTLLTYTDVGGKKALDVNIAKGINVEVDLSHVDDSVALGDGTNLFTSTTVGADIGLDVNLINASVVVSATNLDIRDLAFATDKVDVSGSEVSLDAATLAALETITVEQGTNPWIIGDGGGSITVDFTRLDHTTDSVASWLVDSAGTALTSTLVGADQALDVNVVQATDAGTANTAVKAKAKQLTVANTNEDIIAVGDVLANRKYLWLYNFGRQEVYIGENGFAFADGFPIPQGSILEMRLGAAVDIEFVGESGANGAKAELRTLQAS